MAVTSGVAEGQECNVTELLTGSSLTVLVLTQF